MLPPLVQRALSLAEALGFGSSCSEETGRLLHLLAAQRGRSRIAEIGSGCGVGTAWLLSALEPAATFLTVELDRDRAAAVRELLEDDVNAHVFTGHWRACLARAAPFDLLFADGGRAKAEAELEGLLAPGGTLVLDDLTPDRAGADPVRELWLNHPRFTASELRVSERESVILAVLQFR